MLPRAATEFYALQQRVNLTTRNEVARLWRRMGDDFDASWRRYGPAVLTVIIEAQQVVADAAIEYVPNVLAEAGIPDRPEGRFQPRSLIAVASDGRALDTLAYGGVTRAKTAISDGATTPAALDSGGQWLELMARLQVADTARQAVGVMMASRKNLGGTVRVLNPPSCQRCAILAGRFYRWSQGFDRHPKCDCVNQPVPSESYAKAEGFITDPMDAYRRGEIKDLTEAQKFALDNGADIGRVVNATRGMSTTATSRPLASKQRRYGPGKSPEPVVLPGMPDLLADIRAMTRRPTEAGGFLTPEGIYQQANGDRDRAIDLLREWGYLT